MTINVDLTAKILRYHHVEKWRIGTIARQLNVHHYVVERVLRQAGVPRAALAKGSIIDPFLPFILETLEKFPKLTASRLYNMVSERGFKGSEHHFRHYIALNRPRPVTEAYLRLRTTPGEQAQVDWGSFGDLMIGQAKRKLVAFVMVLSYSRKIFLRFYLNQQMANFLRGHEAAFNAFSGVPRVLLYDNLKSAVLERMGDAIRFHPTLLNFAAHYRYEPRPVAVARGNEKGRVERAIRYIRDNFFAARTFNSLDDLNQQAEKWCEQSCHRQCPEDRPKTVGEVFLIEQPALIKLPDNPYPTDERVEVKSGKTPYVRFDLNDYSIPHDSVRQTLTVSATLKNVLVLDGMKVIASHERSFDKGKQVEDPTHIASLVELKHKAHAHSAQNRLSHAVQNGKAFLKLAALHGHPLRTITRSLLKLLDRYGATELESAITEAIGRGVSHPNAIRLVLERRREEKNLPPPVILDLPDDKRVRELVVIPHKLNDYDKLQTFTGVNEDEE